MANYSERQEKLRQLLHREKAPAVYISKPVNVQYLTGFTGGAGGFLFTADRSLLISDGRFIAQLQEECPGQDVLIRTDKQTPNEATAQGIAQLGVSEVVVEASHLTLTNWEDLRRLSPGVTFGQQVGWVESLRAIKDAGELQTIRKAIAVAAEAFSAFRPTLRADDTEHDLVNRLEWEMRQRGASRAAFDIIVGIGDRAALPHCPPSERRLAQHPMLLIDWGAEYHGYKSDFTRCIKNPFVAREDFRQVENRLREVYNNLLHAQACAVEQLRPGTPLANVDAAARKHLHDAGLGEFFTHSVGHGFGLEIHENPFLRTTSTGALAPGMVITLEPGVYLPGDIGMRIEDDYLITETGYERLTQLPRDWDFFLGAD